MKLFASFLFILASTIAACATTTDRDDAPTQTSGLGKADDASGEPRLVDLVVDADLQVFTIRCTEDERFAFKFRGVVLSGQVYPAGWLDVSTADLWDLDPRRGWDSGTATVIPSTPADIFLELEPSSPDLVEGTSYTANSYLTFHVEDEQLVAAGSLAGRDGAWSCGLHGYDGETWHSLL